jgi:hypothetical protein
MKKVSIEQDKSIFLCKKMVNRLRLKKKGSIFRRTKRFFAGNSRAMVKKITKYGR